MNRFPNLLAYLLLIWAIFSVENIYSNSINNALLTDNANTIIEMSFIIFEVQTASSANEKHYFKATILNEDSYYNQLAIYYDSFKKVKTLNAKIYDSNGKLIKKTRMKEVKDYSAVSNSSIYEDTRVKFLDLSNPTYPYTIELEYEITHTGLGSYPTWYVQQFNTSVQQAKYTLKLPKNFTVYHKVINGNIFPTERMEQEYRIIDWQVNNLPAIIKETYAPDAEQLLPQILLAPNSFKIGKYRGSMSSWKNFGVFMNQLWKGKDELSPNMKSKVLALTAETSTDTEKIEILFQYLQENMRYVSVQLGIGGWQPFDANYVETKKYGDCKALTNFMKAMLKEVGIESFPALISSGETGHIIEEDFVSPYFNHVILYVPSENIWLECTSSKALVGYLGLTNASKTVLLLTKNGGKLAQTPAITEKNNYQKSIATIQLLATTDAIIQVQQQTKFSQHDWIRYVHDSYTKEQIEEQIKNRTSFPTSSIQDIQIEVADDQPEADIQYTAKVNRYSSKAGKRLFVPINCIDAFSFIPKKEANRTFPVISKRGYWNEGQYTFILPDGYIVENCPTDSIQLTTKFGTYILSCKVEGNQLLITRSLLMQPFEAAPIEYKDFRNFFRAIAKADSGKIVLVEK